MKRRWQGVLVGLVVGLLWCVCEGKAYADLAKEIRKLKGEVERLKSSQVDQDERQMRAERGQEERFKQLAKALREGAEKQEQALNRRMSRLEGEFKVRAEQERQALNHRMLRLEGEMRQKDAEREGRIIRLEKALRERLEKQVRGLTEQNARLERALKSLREGLEQQRAERALERKRRMVRRYMARGKREEGRSLGKAREWYAKACSLGEDGGCAKAWEMGLKWCKGAESEPSKWGDADRWYKSACEKGYAEGCKARGKAWFARGKGMAGEDRKLALYWLKMACGVGHAEACQMPEGLKALERGKAAEGRSLSEALVWYSKACRLGQKEGCNSVERLSRPSGARRIFRVKGATFAMRWIPAGSFTMGSPENEPNRSSSEGPQRSVTISKGYWMLESEVTQGQYKALMGSNPSRFSSCGDNCPVEGVSWYEARAFAEKLSEAQGLAACTARDRRIFDCKGWRLPTEAEWEYAARAGTTTAFHTGDCISTDQANYDGNYPQQGCAKGEYRSKTIEVCSLARNAWGLCDMHGNVWEWVMDGYGSYEGMGTQDPLRSSGGAKRVNRGGGWSGYARAVRSADRDYVAPTDRYYNLGFRLLRY